MLPRLALRHPPETTVALSIEGQPVLRRIDVITRSSTSQRPHQRIVLSELLRASRDLLDEQSEGRDQQRASR